MMNTPYNTPRDEETPAEEYNRLLSAEKNFTDELNKITKQYYSGLLSEPEYRKQLQNNTELHAKRLLRIAALKRALKKIC